jgi:hypothetical protein
MDQTLHTGPTGVHRDAPTAVILAHATLALDEVVKVGHETQAQWELTQRALAVMTLGIMVFDPAYRLPPVVREALGGNFYEGTLLSAAVRLGWAKPVHTHDLTDEGPVVATEYEVTDDSPWDVHDLSEAIAEVGS